jgi:TPR repeat protein
MKWYRLAADHQGYSAPLYALGLMYVNGHGVAQDNARASMWYNLAASSGDYAGALLRDALAKKMTSAQFAQGQEMTKRCQQPKHKDCG